MNNNLESENAKTVYDLACASISGQGDGRISQSEMEKLIKYSNKNIDLETINVLFHIYSNFKLTEPAKKTFHKQIYEWAWYSNKIQQLGKKLSA